MSHPMFKICSLVSECVSVYVRMHWCMCTHKLSIHEFNNVQGHSQDFTKGVSSDIRSQMRGSQTLTNN